MYLLISTDGYSISTEKFMNHDSALNAMTEQYNERNRNELNDEWDEMSHITSDDALLYDMGENVYVWSIIQI